MRRFRLPKITPREWPAMARTGYANIRRDYAQMRGTNVWIFIVYGLLFDMVNNLWRPFSAVFLYRLGGGDLHISLLSSLPGAVGAIVLLPGAILFRRFTNQKRATAAFILISRAMLLLIVFVPVLPPVMRPMLFIILVSIMNFPDALSQTSLQAFLGTVFNGSTRGQAIALRTKFGQAVIPIVTLVSGLIITFLPATDEQRLFFYQLFFVAAFVLGVVEVLVFRRLQVPEISTAVAEKPPRVGIRVILRDKKFLAFVVPAVAFAFTWQAGWPLTNIYNITVLQATEMWFAVFALTAGLASFISGTFWQRLLRKHGNNATFTVAAALIACNIIVFPLVPNVYVMSVVFLLVGVSAIGINTALLNGVLEATPDENRMVYLATYNTLMSISLFVSPFFAFAMVAWLGINWALVIVGVLRTAAAVYIFLVGSSRVRAAKAD